MRRYSKTSRTSIKMKSAYKRNGRRRYHEDKVAPEYFKKHEDSGKHRKKTWEADSGKHRKQTPGSMKTS